jgi:hypothetical protein
MQAHGDPRDSAAHSIPDPGAAVSEAALCLCQAAFFLMHSIHLPMETTAWNYYTPS